MAFDPNKWLAENPEPQADSPVVTPARSAPFDPNKWLAENPAIVPPQASQNVPSTSAPFDPQAWLAANPEQEPVQAPPSQQSQSLARKLAPAATVGGSAVPAAPPPIPTRPGTSMDDVRRRVFAAEDAYRANPTKENEVAMRQARYRYETIQGIRKDIQGGAVEQNAERQSESAGRAAYAGPRAAVSRASLGFADRWLADREKRTLGEEFTPQTDAEQKATAAYGFLGSVSGAMATGKAVGGATGRINNGLLRTAATRLSTAAITSGATNLNDYGNGKVSGKEAAYNVGQNIAAVAIGMLPENAVNPGVKNFAAQVGTDLLVDLLSDSVLTRRLQDKGFAKWFMENEVYSLASSVAFAAQDYGDPNFARQQEAVRKGARDIKARWGEGGTKKGKVNYEAETARVQADMQKRYAEAAGRREAVGVPSPRAPDAEAPEAAPDQSGVTGRSPVSAPTRADVLARMEQMGYTPEDQPRLLKLFEEHGVTDDAAILAELDVMDKAQRRVERQKEADRAKTSALAEEARRNPDVRRQAVQARSAREAATADLAEAKLAEVKAKVEGNTEAAAAARSEIDRLQALLDQEAEGIDAGRMARGDEQAPEEVPPQMLPEAQDVEAPNALVPKQPTRAPKHPSAPPPVLADGTPEHVIRPKAEANLDYIEGFSKSLSAVAGEDILTGRTPVRGEDGEGYIEGWTSTQKYAGEFAGWDKRTAGQLASGLKALRENRTLTPGQWDAVARAMDVLQSQVEDRPLTVSVNEAQIKGQSLVRIDGEWYRAKREDDGTLTLQGGKVLKVGSFDSVEAEGVIEKGKRGYTQAERDWKAQKEAEKAEAQPLNLESATPEQLASERAKAERKAKIAEGRAKPLVGKPIDTTGDLLDPTRAENPLFAAPTPKAKPEAKPEAKPAAEAKPKTLAERVEAGEPVKPPAGATFARATHADGGVSVVSVKDLDTLSATGVVKVEFGVRGKGNKGEFVPTKEAARDIKAEAKRQAKAGYVDPAVVKSLPERITAAIKHAFSTTKSLGKAAHDAYVRFLSHNEAATLMERRLNHLVDDLTKAAGSDAAERQDVRTAILDYVEGRATSADVDAIMARMRASNPARAREYKALLDDAVAAIRTRGVALADMLAEAYGDDHPLVVQIRNNPAYATVFYGRGVLGEKYEPTEADFNAATQKMRGILQGHIDQLSNKIAGLRPAFPRIIDWLETGNTSLLRGLPPEVEAAALALGRSYFRFKHIIDGISHTPAGTVNIRLVTDAFDNAARGMVHQLLDWDSPQRGRGGIFDTTSLMRRTLTDPVIQALYGKVRDPALILGRTAQVQESLLAQQTFLHALFAGERGRLWETMRDDSKGFTIQLGSDGSAQSLRRYGNLAGMWVNKDMAAAFGIKPDEPTSRFMQTAGRITEASRHIASWLRRMPLLSRSNWQRNFTNTVTHYAAGAGDLFLPKFLPELGRGINLVRRAMANDQKALAEIEELARKDVFRVGASAIIDDMRAGTTVGGKIGKFFDDVHKAYAYINFFAKYAAFKARMADGMTEQQAIAHVNRFYEYKENLPQLASSLSRNPFMLDYASYKVMSTKILYEQVKNVAQQVKARNVKEAARAMAGLSMGRAYWLATRGAVVSSIASALAGLRSFLGDKEVKGDKVEILKDDEAGSLRSLVPTYDRDEALVQWRTVNPSTGKRTYHYAVIGGGAVSAFPLEDMLYGTMQSMAQGRDPGEIIGQIGMDEIGPGMLPQTVADLFGFDLRKMRKTKPGVFEAWGRVEEDPEEFKKALRELIVKRALPGEVDKWLRYSLAIDEAEKRAKREAAGIPQKPGIIEQPTDVLLRNVNPAAIRVYRRDPEDIDAMVLSAAREYALTARGIAANISKEYRDNVVKAADLPEKQEKRAAYLMKITQVLDAARKLDPERYTDEALVDLLKSGNVMQEDDAWAIVEGRKPEPYVSKAEEGPKPRRGMSIGVPSISIRSL